MHGSLLFLCENETGLTIYKAKLHNPISEIVKLSDDCEGDRIFYHQSWLVYCYEGSSVSFHPVDKAFDPKFSVSKFKSKKAIVNKLSLLNLFLKLELLQLVKNGYRNIKKLFLRSTKTTRRMWSSFTMVTESLAIALFTRNIKDTP